MQENKDLVRRYLDEVGNLRKFEVFNEIAAERFVFWSAQGRPLYGRTAYMKSVRRLLAAFPDWQVSTEAIIAEGDMVTDWVRVTATHTAQSTGSAPTGLAVSNEEGVHVWRIEDGKLAEMRFLSTPRMWELMKAGVTPVPTVRSSI